MQAAPREQVDELRAGVRDRDVARLRYVDRLPFTGRYYVLYCSDPMGLEVEVVRPADAGGGRGSAGP